MARFAIFDTVLLLTPISREMSSALVAARPRAADGRLRSLMLRVWLTLGFVRLIRPLAVRLPPGGAGRPLANQVEAISVDRTGSCSRSYSYFSFVSCSCLVSMVSFLKQSAEGLTVVRAEGSVRSLRLPISWPGICR